MKKKLGFTLAEVLITLAIIGIIAALVLPAVLNNFQFRAVGVRLSKFMSTVENSTRAYVETEGSLVPGDADNINDYIRRTFSITEIDDGQNNQGQNPAMHNANGLFDITNRATVGPRNDGFDQRIIANDGRDPGDAPIILKDGTRMDVWPLTINAAADGDMFPVGSPVPATDAIGRPALGIVFDPSANALPGAVRRVFGFVVTELGFVFPAPTDACTWSLFINRWQTRPDDFAAGTPCADAGQLGGFTAAEGFPAQNWQNQARGNNNNNQGGNNGGNNGGN